MSEHSSVDRTIGSCRQRTFSSSSLKWKAWQGLAVQRHTLFCFYPVLDPPPHYASFRCRIFSSRQGPGDLGARPVVSGPGLITGARIGQSQSARHTHTAHSPQV